ncbi:MAG: dicarboxylate/amino acid:cation symporter [Lachnospiraceae bacterium]|nr:dicarboxylate/amino acid:cation symporter [Lachnospiraceae bacterium]
MKVLKNYKESLLLLGGMLIGGIVGWIAGPSINVVKPLADMFLHLMFCIAVPMVFVSVVCSIANLKDGKEAGTLLSWTAFFFVITIVIAAIVFTFYFGFLDAAKGAVLANNAAAEEMQEIQIDILGQLTVSDFKDLWSIKQLLAVVVFALITGFSMRSLGQTAEPVRKVFNSLNAVISKFISTIMKFAPIGLGCYFAVFIGSNGSDTAGPMMKLSIVTWVGSFVYLAIAHTIYAFLADGTRGIKTFWTAMIGPFLTALGTCSGAASVPANVEAAKKAGIDDKISSIVMPLGCNLHKEGTAIMVAMTVSFECALLGQSYFDPEILGTCILMSIIYPFVAGAIPSGGPFLLFSVFGWPMETFAAVMALHTITDAPTTTINVVGDLAAGMLIEKQVKKAKSSS